MGARKIYSRDIQINKPKSFSSRTRSNSDGWVVSYADVVTVLLCFFIIFYIVEKQYDRVEGFGPLSGTVQEYKTKMKSQQVLSLIETIEEIPNVTLVNRDQFLEVHFPPEMFFESGKTKLTKNGEKIIEKFSAPLKSIKSGYLIQIQGYSDNTPVRKSDKRWWQTNMELSLERSLQVYSYLKNNGIEKNVLSVAGFGTHKPLKNGQADLQRRISIKLEPVLDNEK